MSRDVQDTPDLGLGGRLSSWDHPGRPGNIQDSPDLGLHGGCLARTSQDVLR